ncbi:hypothetical protein ACE4RV_04810 [Acetobacter persici]|uniref:hypothetical protein n=1 Tax=Acetobacter persici TaxID=1076596 RepID=UPI0036DA86BC
MLLPLSDTERLVSQFCTAGRCFSKKFCDPLRRAQRPAVTPTRQRVAARPDSNHRTAPRSQRPYDPDQRRYTDLPLPLSSPLLRPSISHQAPCSQHWHWHWHWHWHKSPDLRQQPPATSHQPPATSHQQFLA